MKLVGRSEINLQERLNIFIKYKHMVLLDTEFISDDNCFKLKDIQKCSFK